MIITEHCCTVEPLFYDHPQNHIGVVVFKRDGRPRGTWLLYNMCTPEHTYPHTAMHNSSVHTENGFRGVPVVVTDRATNPLQCLQARPHSRRLTQNSVRSPRFQKPGSRKHRSNIDIYTSLAVVTFVLFPL